MAAHPQERVFPNGTGRADRPARRPLPRRAAAGDCVPTPAACVTGIYLQRPSWSRRRAGPAACSACGSIRRAPGSLLAHPLCRAGRRDGGSRRPPRPRHARSWPSGATTPQPESSGCAAPSRGSAASSVGRRARAPWIPRCTGSPAASPTTGGSRPIGALRAETGLTDARLISLFRQQVGVTPKRYARIHRFDRALTLLTRRGCLARRRGPARRLLRPAAHERRVPRDGRAHAPRSSWRRGAIPTA